MLYYYSSSQKMTKISKNIQSACKECNKNFSSRNCYNNLCGPCCILRNDLCSYHGYKLQYTIRDIRKAEYRRISTKHIFDEIYQTKCISKDIISIIIEYIINRKKCDNCDRTINSKHETICFKCNIPLCESCAIKINDCYNCEECYKANRICVKCNIL
jgi:hypothetical protein